MYYLGIDVGGTFTDVALMDDKGEVTIFKVESTPHNPTEGVIRGLSQTALSLGKELGDLLESSSYIAHGTTVATNALLERKGVKVGLITTKGFEDTMFIQRCLGLITGLRDDEIRHFSQRRLPDPIVPRPLVKGVTERIDYKGAEIVPLVESEVRNAVKELVGAGVGAIAVCFLWSFKNPAHEQRVEEIIRLEAPQVLVSLSSYVCPIIREYERMATTTLNAYLTPSITSYVKDLDEELKNKGMKGFLSILNSSGGVLLPSEAGKRGVDLIGSGPSGGVVASQHLGGLLGFRNILTTDMGGTSFDASIIVDGRPALASTVPISKYLIHAPSIELITIGSGGGSIARVEDGKLRVGPESAGAVPGPVCYGRNGVEPTVTDADVVLGLVDPEFFLGGKMTLDKEKAVKAIEEKVAKPLGMDVMHAAGAIKKLVDAQMAEILRTHIFSKGHDPRDFVLFAYGGAGPVHCSGYGADLGVRHIVVPLAATALSALGVASADLVHVAEKSERIQTPISFDVASKYIDAKQVTHSFEILEEQLRKTLESEGVDRENMQFSRTAFFRYRRQINELEIPAPSGKIGSHDIDRWIDDFETAYERLYGKGTAFRESGIEIVTFRVEAVGKIPKPAWKQYDLPKGSASSAVIGERDIFYWEQDAVIPTKIYEESKLLTGHEIEGPGIIRQEGTTTVIGPNQNAYIDQYRNVIIG